MSGGLPGRERERRLLAGSIRSAATGTGSVVLVEGPAGIGKSRLLRDAAEHARRAGFLVLCAGDGTAGPAGPAPCWPLSGAAPRRTDPARPVDRPKRTDPRPGGVAGPRAGGNPDRRRQDRDPAPGADRIRAALSESPAGPLLVALDDLQWADEDTLRAVGELAPRAGSVLWLLARRPAPASPPLVELVEELTADGATLVSLAPLPAEAAVALTADLLHGAPDQVLRALVDKCGGNPFLIVELLSALVDDDSVLVDSTGARLAIGGRPDRLYQRVCGRVRPLSGPTRQLLQVAAVFGRTVEVQHLAEVLGSPVARLLPAIQEAVEAGVLAETGSRLTFRHQLLREAAYGALPAATRLALHRAAAHALLEGGSPVRAAHLATAAAVGDTDAVRTLERAADAVAPGDPGLAADLGLRALTLSSSDGVGRADRVASTAGLLSRAGRWPEAESLASAEIAGGHPAAAAVVGLPLAEALLLGGKPGPALDRGRRTAALPGLPPATEAMLVALQARALADLDQLSAARELGERAAGRIGGPDQAACRGLLAIGQAQLQRGHLAAALAATQQAVEMAGAGSPAARLLLPQWQRGLVLAAQDRFDEALASYDDADREAGRLATSWARTAGSAHRATLLLLEGRLDDAAAAAGMALARTDEVDGSAAVPQLLAVLALVAVHRGDLDGARRRLGRSPLPTADTPGPMRLAWVAAVVDEADGHPERAHAAVRPIHDALPHHPACLVADPTVGPLLVRLAMRAGDAGRARTAAAAIRRLATLNPAVATLAAAADQARGLLERDASQLAAAADAFRASPRPLARAAADEDAGVALAEAGARDRAIGYLVRARDAQDELGGWLPAARLRGRLRALGVRDRRRATSRRPAFGWGSLTAAELRVARVAASGLTNRAIADRLSLSPHTVESHLRHCFAKLGIRSRVELTRVLVQHEPA